MTDTLKAGVSAAVMGGAVLAFKSVTHAGSLVTLAVGGLIGVGVYFGLALLLGIQEVRTIPQAALRGLLKGRA